VAGDIDRTALRVRLGLGLFIVSWLPIAQIVIAVLGLHDGTTTTVRATIWAVQWIIGIVGLLIAGKAVATVVRRSGWRRTPRLMWRMLRTGRVAEDPVASTHGQS
jgi:hypothetical protein